MRSRAHAALGALTPTPLAFTAAEVAQGASKRLSSTDYVAALLAGLNRDLALPVSVLGLALPTDPAGQTAGIVAGAAPALDQLIAGVLASLGVSVGQAGVWVTGVRCRGGVLAH